ncbi:Hypothetical protein LUCI_0875 [Lucifera butyrica]|uniref:Large ribosomal rna subunit accumulation protein yced n=2 Tax=Lucifera butyrica TaxID=1351585 RepID=A0A498R3C9_9FIRM|nr:Hypothetical protein LUCI_0875 [Lucifera butyrica]
MKINLLPIKTQVGSHKSFSFVASAGELGIPGEQDHFDGDITVKGQVINLGPGFKVEGTIYARAEYPCNRCLEPFFTTLEIPFEDEYQESRNETDDPQAEVAYFQGDELDLTDLIRESLLLAEPLQIVCSENCRGLCSQCGANLNVKACSCKRNDIDPRLAALQHFLEHK